MLKHVIWLLGLVLALAACDTTQPSQVALPLHESKPTFLFFYADN